MHRRDSDPHPLLYEHRLYESTLKLALTRARSWPPTTLARPGKINSTSPSNKEVDVIAAVAKSSTHYSPAASSSLSQSWLQQTTVALIATPDHYSAKKRMLLPGRESGYCCYCRKHHRNTLAPMFLLHLFEKIIANINQVRVDSLIYKLSIV